MPEDGGGSGQNALNRQVRRLLDGRLQEGHVFVEDRDTNAILREYMRTEDRNPGGVRALMRLHDFIDQGRGEEAAALYQELRARWGDLDPELTEAGTLMDPEESGAWDIEASASETDRMAAEVARAC